MGDEHSVKNLVSRTESDPWNAVLGRRPATYKIPEIGFSLMHAIDYAMFERRLEKAIMTGVILERWAEGVEHFYCKAPAVMSTVYSVGGIREVAEEKIIEAKKRVGTCADCKAHYLKRNGIYLIYEEDYTASLQAYGQAIALFHELDDHLERAKCFIGRGVVKYLMHDYPSALHDQEEGMQLLGADSGHYLIFGVINSAAILIKMGRREDAQKKVEEAQELLAGIPDVERPKLILRWTKSLLLEGSGDNNDRKLAAQMIDRVEVRMRKLSMQREMRVLLADMARIARAPHTIRRIACKALGIEERPRVRALIQAVIDDPSREKIILWREALDSYVPPFVDVA